MLAIQASTLIDGTGNVSKEVVVLVDGERITAVAKAAELTIPPDAEVIDASSKTLMPGLIDAHVHLRNSMDPKLAPPPIIEVQELLAKTALRCYVNGIRMIEAGFTTVRDAGLSRNFEDIALRDAINQGWVKGPRMRVCGQGLSTTGGHMDQTKGFIPGATHPGLNFLVDSPWDAQRAVRYQLKMGVDQIKINATDGTYVREYGEVTAPEMPRALLDAICEVAHNHKRKVLAHSHGGPGVRDAILAGVDSLEHGAGLSDEDLDLMVERGTYWVPTLTVMANSYATRFDEGVSPTSRMWSERNYEAVFLAVEKAVKKGVKIGAGTDAGETVLHGKEDARELELLVKGGMTPMQAIVAATKVNAELLDWGDDLGTVEAGKWADMIVVDGDPLADIRILQDHSRIKQVIKNGEVLVSRA